MPVVRPFQGIRFASEDVADLVCPPYDVISDEERDALYDAHPHNAIRLELARDEGGDSVHDQVGRRLDGWLTEGILARDHEPAYYVYRQDFRTDSGARLHVVGVIGALQLEEFGHDSGVLPHERTMSGPKEDRLALLRAARANISPIYAIYRGGGRLAPFLGQLEERPAAVRFTDADGILHRMWSVGAPAEVAAIGDALAAQPLVIADGHHRYETALAYHRERVGEPGGHNAIMTFCVDADSEHLVVLPYHRALKTDADLVAEVGSNFGGRSVGRDPMAELLESSADHPFALVTESQRVMVEIDDSAVDAVLGEAAPAWRSLDVVVLHEVVLRDLAHRIDEMTFSRDAAHIERLVADGWDVGILLRPLSAVQVVDVARSGERMPQKASYFWPKAITGLVLHALD